MSDKGTGYLDVTPELLPTLLSAWLPPSYKVIGSEDAMGYVRLVVESANLVGHGHALTCRVEDAGDTRTVTFAIQATAAPDVEWDRVNLKPAVFE